MIHKLVSFYREDMNPLVVETQNKVFSKFNLQLDQIPFSVRDVHFYAIDTFLQKDYLEYDLITIFDVDCIPINIDFLEKIYNNVKDDYTIYGNVQSSNTLPHNTYRSLPFIAPSFISFTKKLYTDSFYKSFSTGYYPNPNGELAETDVAEIFSRENEKRGVKLVYAYPTRTYEDTPWENNGVFGNKPFKLGIGTEFESNTYHHYCIREEHNHKKFIDYCEKIIFEN